MKALLFILLSALSSLSFSQGVEITTTNNKGIDSNYIEDFSHKLVLRTFFKRKLNKLEIEDTKNSNKITFKPNQSGALGAGFNYKWLGIDLAFKIPNTNEENNNNLGESKAFDIQSNIYMRKFAIDLFYLNYKGYYIDNSSNFGSPDEKIEYPHLRSGIIGANFNYLFNHKKFSYRAVYLQNERQKKSAGSVIIGAFVSQNYIKSDSSIIPKNARNDFPGSANITDAKFTLIGAQAGYAHSFVFKKIYLTISLSLGLGGQNTKTKAINEEDSKTVSSITSKAQSRFALGYNGDQFNIGIQNTNNTYLLGDQKENTSINYQVGSFKFFLAYRFKAPKVLEKIGKIKIF